MVGVEPAVLVEKFENPLVSWLPFVFFGDWIADVAAVVIFFYHSELIGLVHGEFVEPLIVRGLSKSVAADSIFSGWSVSGDPKHFVRSHHFHQRPLG